MKKILWTIDKVSLLGPNSYRLEDIVLDIQTGITAVLGQSGAGKTSILRMIAGLLKPDEGQIIVNNKTWLDSKKKIYQSHTCTNIRLSLLGN